LTGGAGSSEFGDYLAKRGEVTAVTGQKASDHLGQHGDLSSELAGPLPQPGHLPGIRLGKPQAVRPRRPGEVTHPVLVLGGRHDRTCAVAASQDMAGRLPDAELVVFEDSAHMVFAEEQDRYLAAVRQFLDRITS
jgi:pimeloyl-ACP methyl ester carboxylesterase